MSNLSHVVLDYQPRRKQVSRSVLCYVAAVIMLMLPALCLGQIPPPPNEHGATGNQPLRPTEKDGKWGYVDATGSVVIPPQFDSAAPFSDGLAVVELNHRFGYIGPDGRFVVQPKYYKAEPFKDGLALVCTKRPSTPLGTGEYGVSLFTDFTYIDRSGREIRHPFFAEYASNFSEGLAAVKPGVMLGGCAKGGYLNTKGEWSIKPQFDEVHDFSEGLAAVNEGGKCGAGGKWGYIDRDGGLVIPFEFDFAGNFQNGRACVKEAGRWKFVDAKGNTTPVEENECLP
jgi:hypothetical protein